ncbi:putative disease resistance RPP13-like protein 1 [Vitis vinifera]|uniref:Putative disease resistance RPP13-like protein 1 n=1 Tax=Vitis vinifera TaxID=29760 RepID=A0A438CMU1_VITVI|nr:putative disease resistance RPP13-like protein 1 [Vitis vinifera]
MVGAIVGGAFLSASIQVLLDRLASRNVLTFLRGQKLSATLLRKLKIKLVAVQAVLDDAEAKQFTKSAVKDWMDDLKDAVYDAEDLLDEITTEALRCKMESDAQTSATQYVTSPLPRLIRLVRESSPGWPATSLVDESGEVYGREGNIQEIVEYLLSHNASGNKISVIALVVWAVLERPHLLNWSIMIGGWWNVLTLKLGDLNLLQLKVKERLSKKKFLLVLDDVWNENYTNWHMLQTPLTVGLNGSKIIVTTRSDKVASIMRSVRIHHLGQLSFEDCWSLFAKHAFENGDSSLHSELEEIGKGFGVWILLNFPKDYEFEKENLILLWIAEGFLQQSEGKKTMEEDGKMNEILEKLRHLSYFRSEYDHFERFETLNEVNCLRTFLPLNLRTWPRFDKVSKNRNLNATKHSKVKEMPSHMGQLKSLQKLSNYIVGKQSGTRVGELRKLSHIGGSLVIQELQNVVDAKDASEANLVGKQNLDELELEWHCGSNVEQNGEDIVLNNLQPHSNLKRLTIHGYGGSRFPDWLGYAKMEEMVVHGRPRWRIPRLKKLYIEDCPRLIGDFPTHLPFLMTLRIEECEQLVAPLPRVPAIRQLTTRSCDISQWKELPPLLQYLSIQNSDSLESLLEEGMLQKGDVTSFHALNIRRCPNLVSIELPALEFSRYSILNCKNLKWLLHNATCFQSLTIEGCPELIFQYKRSVTAQAPILDRRAAGHQPFCSNNPELPIAERSMFSSGTSNSKSSASVMPSPSHLHDCHPPLSFTLLMGLPSNLNSLTMTNCNKLTSHMDWPARLASLALSKSQAFQISGPWTVWGFNCSPLSKIRDL